MKAMSDKASLSEQWQDFRAHELVWSRSAAFVKVAPWSQRTRTAARLTTLRVSVLALTWIVLGEKL